MGDHECPNEFSEHSARLAYLRDTVCNDECESLRLAPASGATEDNREREGIVDNERTTSMAC